MNKHAFQLKFSQMRDCLTCCFICKEYMCKMKDLNYPLHPLLPTPLDDTCPYTLRHKSDQLYFYKNVTTCRMKCTEDFFTFKYF